MTREVYIMCVWHGPADSESLPVALTNTQGGHTYTFTDLDEVVAFFKEKLKDSCTSPSQNDVREMALSGRELLF